MTAVSPRSKTVSPTVSIPAYYRMLLRGQLTRGRLVGLGILAMFSVLLAFVTRNGAVPERDAVAVLSEYSISVLIPLAALILATPMLGNLIEDRLLVYLWLKPVPRWHLAAAAYLAVVTILLPVVVVPMALSAAVTGFGSLIVPTILASVLGVLAYSAINLFLGARLSWGLWLGLLYLLLWENVLARLGGGTARLSIRSYLTTALQRGTEVPIDLADRAGWASVLIPLLVAIVGVVLTAQTLARKDID